jgi:hypothetical protein
MIILCLLNILYCDKSKTNFKKYRFEPLKQVSEFYIKEYSNGLRHVHIPSNSNIIHAAVTINVGTRHEEAKLNGIAHFVEHLLFKGTKSRKTFHILNRIDSVGGELNAYTTKEETCIYASCTKEYFERALDILADVSFHSIFPEKEIEKEREVIIDEIGSYLDTPSEQIFDDFEELILKYDSEDTYIYLDPPYFRPDENGEDDAKRLFWYGADKEGVFGPASHRRLLELLKKTKCRWSLSYYYFPLLEELLPRDKYRWTEKEVFRSSAQGGNNANTKKKQSNGVELLIMNYDENGVKF